MIDNEEKVVAELQLVSKSNDILTKYMELATIIQNTTQPGQIGVAALTSLEQIFVGEPKMTLDSLTNILCLATADSGHSWANTKLNTCSLAWHKSLSVILATFLKESKLNSEDAQDSQMMIHWLNKLSFCLFKLCQSTDHSQNVCLPFVRLCTFSEFFADIDFANETYFRFLKKYLADCSNSLQLQKVLILLDIFTKEDEKAVLFSFPKLLPDAIDTLSVCAKGLLLGEELHSEPQATLECLKKIHGVQASLFDLLLEFFAKFDMRALDCLTSIKLISHLTEVTKLFSAEAVTNEEIEFRLPVLKILVSLCKISHRFDVEVQTLAAENRAVVLRMLEGCEFKPTFHFLTEWTKRILVDVLKMGKIVHPQSQFIQVDYLHLCMEALAFGMDINSLSLEIQKSAEQ